MMSRIRENQVAATIVADMVYLPSEVCDRIVVRDGKIFFVEIKKPGDKLREKQREFSELVGSQYEIMYG